MNISHLLICGGFSGLLCANAMPWPSLSAHAFEILLLPHLCSFLNAAMTIVREAV